MTTPNAPATVEPLIEALDEIASADWPDTEESSGMYRIRRFAERAIAEYNRRAGSADAEAKADPPDKHPR